MRGTIASKNHLLSRSQSMGNFWGLKLQQTALNLRSRTFARPPSTSVLALGTPTIRQCEWRPCFWGANLYAQTSYLQDYLNARCWSQCCVGCVSCAAHSSNRSPRCNTIVARIVAVKANYIHQIWRCGVSLPYLPYRLPVWL